MMKTTSSSSLSSSSSSPSVTLSSTSSSTSSWTSSSTSKEQRRFKLNLGSPSISVLVSFSFLILVCLLVDTAAGSSSSAGQGGGGGGHGEEGVHGEGGGENEEGGHRFQVAKLDFGYVKTYFMVGIFVLFACLAKIFFHWEKYLSQIFPESCMLILIGIIVGGGLYGCNETGYELNTTTFFLILLPPIILDAGYFMPARPFFDNLGTIVLYAIMGTLLNTLWLGFALFGVYEGGGFSSLGSPLLLLHSLVFASLLAAVDPVAVIAVFESVHVNDILYIVVFGESLLNDGISVVLYHMFEGFSDIGIENILGIDIVAGIASFFVIVFGAVGIGMLLGLFGGFLSRFTRHVRVMEPTLVCVIGYLSFVIAEMFHLSGILSCTFCGITMRKYVEANFSIKSQTTIRYILKMAATVCEIIIFMYLGISAVSDVHHWDTAFVILTVVFCLIFRTLGVIVLTYLANLIRVVKLNKIDQFIMAYGGLRGAIAFALVVLLDGEHFPHRKMFITTTIVVIYFTNLAMYMDHVMGGIEDIADQVGHHLFRERFSYFNNTYLKPLIVGKSNPQRRGWQIMSVFNTTNEKDAKKILKTSPSLTSLFRSMSQHDISRSSSFGTLGPFTRIQGVGDGDVPDGYVNQTWWESHANALHARGGGLESLQSPSIQSPDSLVCLDLNAFDSQRTAESRKMRDASKTHHISENSVSHPSSANRDQRRTLHDLNSPPPFSSAAAPVYTVSTAGGAGGRTPPSEYDNVMNHLGAANSLNSLDSRSRKVVSFAGDDGDELPLSPSSLRHGGTGGAAGDGGRGGNQDQRRRKTGEEDDGESKGAIMFVALPEPTAAESFLPWKRSLDDHPLFSPSASAPPPSSRSQYLFTREELEQELLEADKMAARPKDTSIQLGAINLGYAAEVRDEAEDMDQARSSSTASTSTGAGSASPTNDSNTNNNNNNFITRRPRLHQSPPPLTGAPRLALYPPLLSRPSRRDDRWEQSGDDVMPPDVMSRDVTTGLGSEEEEPIRRIYQRMLGPVTQEAGASPAHEDTSSGGMESGRNGTRDRREGGGEGGGWRGEVEMEDFGVSRLRPQHESKPSS